MQTATLFDQPNILPLRLKRVLMLAATADDSASWLRSPSGRALERLRFDTRLSLKLLHKLPETAMATALREHWRQGLDLLRSHQADGMIWLRPDVVIEDPLLLERLAEAWSMQPAIGLHDDQGRLAFMAVARSADLDAVAEPWIKNDHLVPWPIGLSLDPQTVLERQRFIPSGLKPLLFVCATRADEATFHSQTLTGQSISRLRQLGCEADTLLFTANQEGLPKLYNQAIRPEYRDHVAVFIHDDVRLDDIYLTQRLCEGLLRYDVIGVTGNRNRLPRQPSWAFPQKLGQWDEASNRLGAIGYETSDNGELKSLVTAFGLARGSVRLIDGVFIAASIDVLLQSGTRFDERFRFHFYDLDFCRTAESDGLRLGVWPIALTHLSGGAFGSDWREAFEVYLSKWGG